MSPGRRPRLGLALGAGSARGWAHIGVLETLAEAGIQPAVVCGTSIGALVGAAAVLGRLEALGRWVRGLSWRDTLRLMDFTLAGGGLIEGRRLMEHLGERLGRELDEVRIESLPLPYGAVATRLDTGREVWLREGPLLEAVRASIAFPGLFTPVRRDGAWLVDGGMVNPVPVSLCRALGAEVVLAVQLQPPGGRPPPPGRVLLRETGSGRERGMAEALREGLQQGLGALLALPEPGATPGVVDVVMESIHHMQRFITRSRLGGDPPDLLLAPRVGDIALMEFHRGREAIAAGREAARHALPFLAEVLGAG
ncbi:MAG: patatin [Gammaproteobacteria bacterium]|nr:MAG: patatin [Gammaproteobacteria bacterium]